MRGHPWFTRKPKKGKGKGEEKRSETLRVTKRGNKLNLIQRKMLGVGDAGRMLNYLRERRTARLDEGSTRERYLSPTQQLSKLHCN